MRWRKLGQVFSPRAHHPWMHSHAANPLPLVLNETTVRVFFSCRDQNNQSYVGFVDLDAQRQFQVTRISQQPALGPGRLGTFDDSGISIGCLLETPAGTDLYYMGWNLKVKVPWGNAIGRARLSPCKEKFLDRNLAPVLDRSEVDPYTLSYPSAINFGGRYLMYYGSNLSWGETEPEMTHHIKIAESNDGQQWKRQGKVAIDLADDGEYALSRPWVFLQGEGLAMLYCRRGHQEPRHYRLGYAVSRDGYEWERKDNEVGLSVSESGWDSEMVGYPASFELGGRRYLLYVGNGYGREGFGLAVQESSNP